MNERKVAELERRLAALDEQADETIAKLERAATINAAMADEAAAAEQYIETTDAKLAMIRGKLHELSALMEELEQQWLKLPLPVTMPPPATPGQN